MSSTDLLGTGSGPAPEDLAVGRKVRLSRLRNSDIPDIQRLVMAPDTRRTWRSRGEYWSPAQLQGRLGTDAVLVGVGRTLGDRTLVGIAELLDLDPLDRRAQLALVAHTDFRTAGLAIELALLFLDRVFAFYPLEKISIMVQAGNQRLVPGLGRVLQHEGVLQRHLIIEGEAIDVELFALWRRDMPRLLRQFRVFSLDQGSPS